MPGIVLGIDLGTSHVRICIPGRGIVLNEPAVIAVDSRTDVMIACGEEANGMLERAPDSIRVIQPMTKGVISDYDYAEKMLCTFVRRVCAYKVLKPRAAICIPSSLTEVERRSVIEAVSAAGTRKAILIESSVATAIGAGVDITTPRGAAVINIGAGVTDIAVLSLSGIASSNTIRIGCSNMDEAIARYMQLQHNHIIGRVTAENARKSVGYMYGSGNSDIKIKGRDAISGLPSIQTINASEIGEAIREQMNEIMDVIQSTLEKTPPELAGDIMTNGIILAGGGALMKGMAKAISSYTGVPVHIAESPLDCMALGAAKSVKFDFRKYEGIYSVASSQFPLSDTSRLQ